MQELEIFLDTQGPQITDVRINSLTNTYDLFDPKPSTLEPTPLTSSLVVSIRDLPNRIAGFLFQALQQDSGAALDLPVEALGNYQLVGCQWHRADSVHHVDLGRQPRQGGRRSTGRG